MSLLINGGYDGNLDEWDGDGTISRSLGYPRWGCVALAAGQAIRQDVGVGADQLYTLHFFYRLASGATLTAGYGDVTQTFTGTPATTWREGVLYFALDEGDDTSEEVEFSAADAAAWVDSVTLLIGGLPISRADIATRTARAIADLASDASYSTTADATKGPEGDYSDAVDEALRQLGAVTRWGDPDVTRLSAAQINDVLEATKTAMLQKYRQTAALKTDVSLGPRRESQSQIAASIDKMLSGGGEDRRVKMGKLTHPGFEP